MRLGYMTRSGENKYSHRDLVPTVKRRVYGLPYLFNASTLNTRLFFWLSFGTVAHGIEMPRWVLICAQCKTEFEHSQVGDTGMSRLELPAKPDVPTGATCVCPACGHSAT
jgi:hypothetical protein